MNKNVENIIITFIDKATPLLNSTFFGRIGTNVKG